jgi:5-methylcytosine-specific restriction endonuclease McrA
LIYTHRERGHIHSDSPTIDRVNNGNELNINNVQIICRDCNLSKGTKSHDEFVLYCRAIGNKFS